MSFSHGSLPARFRASEHPDFMSPRHKIFAKQNKDVGAGGRNRTGTPLLEQDFKSCVSTNSTTPAAERNRNIKVGDRCNHFSDLKLLFSLD